MSEPLTRPQQIVIQIARKQLNLGDEQYRSVIQRVTADEWSAGKVSSTTLTRAEATAVIKELEAMGYTSEKPKRPRGSVTKAQLKKLAELSGQIAWRSKSGYHGMCNRMLQKHEPETTAEASRMIETLKAMRFNDMLYKFKRGVDLDYIMNEYKIVDLNEFTELKQKIWNKARG